MNGRRLAAWIAALSLVGGPGVALAAPYGRAVFDDRREPPGHAALDDVAREQRELGHAVFNTHWVAAGTPRAQRRDGVGPLFNAPACDACHNEGARSQGASGDGLAPIGLVVQLGRRATGDPRYGHVLNTSALAPLAAEAVVHVQYRLRDGRYPDGAPWQLREPNYVLSELRYGALAQDSVIQPRLGPALFGVGLLEAVADTHIVALSRVRHRDGVRGVPAWRGVDGRRQLGRFGWQADAVSVEQQTALALSREMGLSSRLFDHDDCTAEQSDCRDAAQGAAPEVADELLAALTLFQRDLAVPQAQPHADDRRIAAQFVTLGCAACHVPSLPVDAIAPGATIDAYSDLLLHDLGSGLADRDARGNIVTSHWRTAPLWGLVHLRRSGREPALLHDGRARSVEEAVLWHDGEAAVARQRFERLPAVQRAALLDWVARR